MARSGHIKMARKAYDSDPFWLESREFSRWEAWEDLIQSAAFKRGKWADGKAIVELQRGETPPRSIRFLAKRWRWTAKKVRVFLDLCIKEDRIRAQQETSQGHTYLLVNYALYQGRGQRKKVQKGTAGAQPGHKIEAGKEEESNDSPSNWVSRAVDLWSDKAGKPNPGRIGKALKPMVEKYDADVVLKVMAYWLDNEDPRFLKVERLAEAFVMWGKQAKEAQDGTTRKGRDGNRNGPRSWGYANTTDEFAGFNEPDPGDTGEVPELDAA